VHTNKHTSIADKQESLAGGALLSALDRSVWRDGMLVLSLAYLLSSIYIVAVNPTNGYWCSCSSLVMCAVDTSLGVEWQ
jgi:hypothetical protein